MNLRSGHRLAKVVIRILARRDVEGTHENRGPQDSLDDGEVTNKIESSSIVRSNSPPPRHITSGRVGITVTSTELLDVAQYISLHLWLTIEPLANP